MEKTKISAHPVFELRFPRLPVLSVTNVSTELPLFIFSAHSKGKLNNFLHNMELVVEHVILPIYFFSRISPFPCQYISTTAPVLSTFICYRSYKILANYSAVKLLKPTGHVMHHQFNIQQLYALPTLHLCVLYLSENKQRLVPLTA